ncbi:MAG: hypothetical protein AAFX87_21335 [Bacteroidota bacterium]
MSTNQIYYIGGFAALAFAVYQVSRGAYDEFILYASSGLAFLTMVLVRQDRFPQYRKVLNIVAWVFILLAAFSLLVLFRNDFRS